MRGQDPPKPRLCDNYRVDFNTIKSERPTVLPSLSPGYTFMVTSNLMQMLRTTGLVFGMASKVPHGHMDKLRSVCKSCVGRPELDMNVIGLRVFPLSLTGDAAVFFFEISQVDSHI